MRLKSLRLGVNPILVKEIRSRMRGGRAFLTLTGVLIVQALFSYGLYRLALASSLFGPTPLSAQIGQTLFTGLAILELLMVCIITPAVTAGSISSEWEKQTYEMLLATPLRPSAILWGKLVSALSYVFLLILAAVPISSLIFTFGGVALRDMLKVVVVLLAVAVTFGVVGLFMSTWLKRTGRATIASYLIVVATVIGPLILYAAVGIFRQAEPPRIILLPNPLSALFSAMNSGGPFSPPTGLLSGLGMLLSGNLSLLSGNPLTSIPRPLYHYTLPLYAVTSLVLYLLATRLARPTRRWRLHFKDVLIGLVPFLILGAAVAAAFLTTADRYEKVSILSAPTPFPLEREVVVEEVMEVPPPPVVDIPTATPLPTPTPLPEVPEEQRLAIYTRVVHHLLAQVPTFGVELDQFADLYLVLSYGDRRPRPYPAPLERLPVLNKRSQESLEQALADLPLQIKWINRFEDAPLDPDTYHVLSGNIIITLGDFHFVSPTHATLPATIYFAEEGLGSLRNLTLETTFTVKQIEGVWQLTETDS